MVQIGSKQTVPTFYILFIKHLPLLLVFFFHLTPTHMYSVRGCEGMLFCEEGSEFNLNYKVIFNLSLANRDKPADV